MTRGVDGSCAIYAHQSPLKYCTFAAELAAYTSGAMYDCLWATDDWKKNHKNMKNCGLRTTEIRCFYRITNVLAIEERVIFLVMS